MGGGKHKDKSKDSIEKRDKKADIAEEVDVEGVPQKNEQDAVPKEPGPGAFDVIFDYFKYNFGISIIGKKNFNKLLQSLPVFAPFGVVFIAVVKAMIFWEAKGEFAVYHISDTYINVGENSFYDLLSVVAAVFVLMFTNMMYVALSIQEYEKFQWIRRKIGILIYWLIEIVILFFFCGGLGLLDIGGLINELTHASLGYVISCLALLLVLIIMSHCFGMAIVIDYNRRKKKQIKAEQGVMKLTVTETIVLFVSIFVAMVVVLGVTSYEQGISKARNRLDYKVVDSSAINSYSGKVKWFAVVFENEDIYILEPINKDGTIDYSVQLNVENKDVLCTYKENIQSANK